MTIPSWAVPGQKVVCINDTFDLLTVPLGLVPNYNMHGLSNGVVYTIRDIVIDPYYIIPTVRLVEIYRQPTRSGVNERGYLISRFRPLITKTQEQDVELFRKIADDVHGRLDVLEEMLNSH